MTVRDMQSLRGELRSDEPMGRHVTWRVGGPADRFYRPADLEDLAAFLRRLPEDEPLFWLGLGSNVLARDGGIRGTVIALQGIMNGIAWQDGSTVRAEAGAPCAKVARFCARHALVGAEFLAGIPGTLGGALAMNAGAFGAETWDCVAAVETLDRRGVRHTRPPQDYRVGYRSVEGPAGEWFIAVRLQLQPGDGEAALARIKELLERRGRSQPIGQPSCGSVFRNPDGDHAARLIEAAGLKGQCVGGACVSEKHANFIINTGKASAADIEALIDKVRAEVERIHGVRLEPEVRIVGDKS
ncbi:MAG: UDP-N-acetylmuramate dehydrogenase [Gammaproteobacteria bacterium]|nr:UDP-N-acetylmuramate dehydrogenase [Gammaproteobacteria bacterium]NIR98321.1 UDP-N-acetylmuramate dehydrogenase [Gammaproteobacteria bacterium]NIT64068.1 UDP-N-acetylmuramate dehydrogenase [Gammaproteobacteria bacterium]NIV20999.1 UDP-N-acetylmuramate dehydrogenase [Gammaproteobacteria bacterium]NIX10396.1 UDP-N-acetylmuramate dehydrogenase [Gammaproteobacteria bacterium]